jgi:adenylate cyclase
VASFSVWRRAGLLRLRIAVIALAAALAISAQMAAPAWMQAVERLVYDLRWRLAPREDGENRIVIIDIDEQSLAQAGDWPWPRSVMARLIGQLLDRYRVRLVALDMVFPERRPGDAALAAQLGRPEVVGAQVFDFAPGSPNHAGKLAGPISVHGPWRGVGSSSLLPKAAGYIANHAGLPPAAAGHISPILDDDGKVRRLYPVVCHREECYAALAVATWLKLSGADGLALQPGSGLRDAPFRLTSAGAEGSVPLAADFSVIIPFGRSRESWRSIPAHEILRGNADPALLRGVIAVVGGTALGLGDVVATPTSSAASGVELHAQLLAALLDRSLPYVPKGAAAYNAAIIVLLGLVLLGGVMASHRDKPRNWVLPVWLLIAVGMATAANFLLWHYARLSLPLAPVLFFILLAMLTLAPAEVYLARRQRQGIFRQLGAYVPEPVARELADRNEVSGNVEAGRRTVTILFADIHDFSAMVEGQPPENIACLLQRVFGDLTEIVFAHRGTVDKFIGDSLMAIWNAPEDDPDHAQHALDAALAIQQCIGAIALLCGELGLMPLRIGIGIQSGEVLVGNFGPVRRRTYTVLGEPVIVASRLEELTRELKQPILVGEAAAKLAGEGRCALLGAFSIRGLSAPHNIFIPLR